MDKEAVWKTSDFWSPTSRCRLEIGTLVGLEEVLL